MIRNWIKRLVKPYLTKRYKKLGEKPHIFRYKSISIIIYPGVFSPKLTISTKIFVDFIQTLNIKSKHVLELGAGNGLISFFSESMGATVWASDISDAALNGLQKNKQRINSSLTIIKSDLFENLNTPIFDFIFINPPYYPKTPVNMEEMAWFCGEDFDFFQNLFVQLGRKVVFKKTQVYMILSQDCNIDAISNIASKHNIDLKKVYQKKKWGESNYIFSLTHLPHKKIAQ